MASTGNNNNNNNLNPWPPYDSYRDCSRGICSVYCPQWCYMVYPPPPPFEFDDDSGTDFSPLIIAVIGILASAFVLVFYYTVISKYCGRRSSGDNAAVDHNQDGGQIDGDQGWQNGNNHNNVGLDEAAIKSITVFKYKKNDGLIDGTDCSVCLSEFQEDDSLRLLPKCSHAFHLPCIDTWLKSHSSCPLCRANINFANHTMGITIHPGNNVSSVHRYQHQNDAVVVIENVQSGVTRSNAVVNVVVDEEVPKTPADRESEDDRRMRRSMSLNSSSSSSSSNNNSSNTPGPVLLVADILRNNEEDDDDGGNGDLQEEKDYRSRVMNMVRSVSTGRFSFSRYGKNGNNSSIVPN